MYKLIFIVYKLICNKIITTLAGFIPIAKFLKFFLEGMEISKRLNVCL